MFIRYSFFILGLAIATIVGSIQSEAAPAAGMYRVEGTASRVAYPVTIDAAFSPEALILTAVMPHPDLSAIECRARDAGDKVWEDESVEFFLAPDTAETDDYRHYSVNAAGIIAAALGTVPTPESAVRLAATAARSRETGSWTLQLAIPWGELGGVLPDGGKLKFNVLRTVRVQDRTLEISSWSKLDLGAHEPWNFGTLTRRGSQLVLEPKHTEIWTGLIPNGGFEAGLDHWSPGTWTGGDMYGDGTFAYTVEPDGIEGVRALKITGRDVGRPRMEAARMGLTGEAVRLEPGRYVLAGYYRCIPTGPAPVPGQLASVFAAGGNQEIFLGESPGWKRFECVFELKDAAEIRPMVRLWSNGSVWFDGLEIAPWQAPAETPTVLSTERVVDGTRYTLVQNEFETPGTRAAARVAADGLALFQRPPEQLQPDSAPKDDELCDRIDDVAIAGTRALQFLNLYGRGDWRIELADGGTLPPEWLTVSRIPFWLQRTDYDGKQIRWMAEVLVPLNRAESVTVAPEALGVVALQWDVPPGAAAGIYHGDLLFSDAGVTRTLRLPVTLEVGGFTLPEADPGFGLWVAPGQLPGVLDYAREAGVHYASFPLPLHPALDPSGQVKLDAAEAIARLRQAEQAGMGTPIPIELSTLSTDLAKLLGLYEKLPKDVTFDSSHLICPPDAASYPAELTRAFDAAIRQLYEQLDRAGLADKVLFYPVDEPTSNPHRMFKALHEGGRIKQLCPKARVFMTAHDLVRTEQLAQGGALDVVCLALGTLHANPEWAQRFHEMAERNHLEVWAYTGSTAENYTRMRLLGGQAAAQKLRRLMLWVSYFDTASTEDEWNDLRAPLKRVATFYPSPTGYRSTIQWEGVRQAILDLRYWNAAQAFVARLPEAEQAAWRQELEASIHPFAGPEEPPPSAASELRRKLFRLLNGK